MVVLYVTKLSYKSMELRSRTINVVCVIGVVGVELGINVYGNSFFADSADLKLAYKFDRRGLWPEN